jgi:hypothetical protein
MHPVSANTTRQRGSSPGTSIIRIVLAIGLSLGLVTGVGSGTMPENISSHQAQRLTGMTDAAVNQEMEYAFLPYSSSSSDVHRRTLHPEVWEDRVRER